MSSLQCRVQRMPQNTPQLPPSLTCSKLNETESSEMVAITTCNVATMTSYCNYCGVKQDVILIVRKDLRCKYEIVTIHVIFTP